MMDHMMGARPGILVLVMVMSDCWPLLAAADPEEVSEGSSDVMDKVSQERSRVTLVPGQIRGWDSQR